MRAAGSFLRDSFSFADALLCAENSRFPFQGRHKHLKTSDEHAAGRREGAASRIPAGKTGTDARVSGRVC